MGTFGPRRSPPPALPASPGTRAGMGGAPPRARAHPWPCALLDARAQGQGGGRGGRFLQSPKGASLSSPWDRDQHLREKYASTLPADPPCRQRSRLSLKRHEPTPPCPAGSREGASPDGPQAGPAHLQSPSRSITTHWPGRGSERASYPPQVTQPGTQ